MQIFAYGSLGLTPDQFWNLTPKEYGFFVKGYGQERERRQKDEEPMLHLLRFIGTTLYNAHRGKGARALSLEDLITLSFDKEKKQQRKQTLTAKQFKNLIKG